VVLSEVLGAIVASFLHFALSLWQSSTLWPGFLQYKHDPLNLRSLFLPFRVPLKRAEKALDESTSCVCRVAHRSGTGTNPHHFTCGFQATPWVPANPYQYSIIFPFFHGLVLFFSLFFSFLYQVTILLNVHYICNYVV